MKNYLIFILLILGAVGLNNLADKYLKKRWNLWLGYGFPVLLMMLFLWNISNPPAQNLFADFDKAYYPAGRLILENPADLYLPDKNCLGQPGCPAGTFVNIPIIAYLFTPFSLLSQQNAHVLLMFLSCIAILFTYYLLIKLGELTTGKQKIALLGLFAINGPLYYNLREGNSTHFVLLLLIAAFFCIQAKREIWTGALLAIAALIKIPLFLFGVYFVMRSRWRVVAGFSAALLAIVGASILLFGFDLHQTWFEMCIQPYAGKPIAAYNSQSLDSFLARLLTDGGLTKWLPLEVGLGFKLVRYALLSLLFGATIWICWRSKKPVTLEEENLELSVVLCLALLTSPISWTHYYLLLLLPLSLYLGNKLAVPNKQLWSSLIILGILLISLPVTYTLAYFKPGNAQFLSYLVSRVFISHYFFGDILLLGVLLAARWQNSKRFQQSQSSLGSL
ncbi:glycosyltransferase family 87 protein [Coleofasciculus sp. FACHB-SPT9]|uniref:glycosyltransferase family 87 protein n=2 Tax=Cyanobacteriota TaxID=1117 RepID=UPI001681EDD4|nr:glycosyltransferase family 87 protein [Coleofasciculus sp. FACHB-SPT9]MBD1889419.1 DUF2029 domain-containing protein [Coleofasciculus sp. FACHB-SPT9]